MEWGGWGEEVSYDLAGSETGEGGGPGEKVAVAVVGLGGGMQNG